jgi:hypothetical protein
MAARYAKKMAEYMNKEISIGLMCPSVMISGGSNFPVRKKEKQNQAWEKNRQFYKETQKILDKMRGVLHGKERILSGDEDAIERLEEKLEKLKDLQTEMKEVNKAIRMKDTEKGDTRLVEMGYSEEQIKALREPDFCGRIGYADYMLRNNNQKIHSTEMRLKSLKEVKEKGTQENESEFFRAVENTELMRLQIFFDGKPEPETREVLKRNGFRWAPSQSAWQRQLTANAKYALRRVEQELRKMKEAE